MERGASQAPAISSHTTASTVKQPPLALDASALHFAHSSYSTGSQPSTPATDLAGQNGAQKQTKQRRKKTDEGTNGTADSGPEKQKRPRKPRDPSKPPGPRKKPKTGEEGPLPPAAASPNSTTSMKISDMMTATPRSTPDVTAATTGKALSLSTKSISTLHTLADQADQVPTHAPQPKPKVTSGPYYDPIRGSSVGAVPSNQFDSSAVYRPSPSISSLINPPSLSNLLSPSRSESPAQHASVESKPLDVAGFPSLHSKAVDIPIDATFATEPKLDVDAQVKRSVTAKGTSPKPGRSTKETKVPVAGGTGLLSGAAFGREDDGGPTGFANVPNQCIIIEVPMTSETGNYVNFMQEVEKKYGFDVAHPKLAEHRRRMKQMAAAGAALDSGAGSADEMAIDFSDADSNADVGGVEDESGPDGGLKKKRRQKRGDEYNKDDDFIDDTELMWEEQALASKDGYFVWSGPLIPEGDKPAVERADGTVRRGRGRGRGSRGGATRGESTRGRGGGRGSRGGPRKRGGRGDHASKAEAAGLALATVPPNVA